MDVMNHLKLEVNGVVIEDAAEKVGAILGEEGRQVGKIIDRLTKNVTIKIGDSTASTESKQN
jgi:hypothetical protein